MVAMATNVYLKGASVLITGGSDGIGLGLATKYLDAGSRVLLTGRRVARLDEVAAAHPGLETFQNDIGTAEGREALAAHVGNVMPDLSIIVNNAGIQRRASLAADTASWSVRMAEVEILLGGPVHLNSLLIPQLLQRGAPARIINVTSGGAYVPQPFAPMYSASKAALRSYTLTLRHALSGTNIDVVELAPPAIRTRLGATAPHGAEIDEFVNAIFPAINATDARTVGFGMTQGPELLGLMAAQDALFDAMSGRFPVPTYASVAGATK
jgi:uncharacterized oxidoreductase